MANTYLPWLVYQDIVAGCLIGLDKCLGVRPVGIHKMLQPMLRKGVLEDCGEGVTHACGVDQWFLGLWGVTEVVIHTMNPL